MSQIPLSIEGISEEAWARQKHLWRLMRKATQGRWDEVRQGLQGLSGSLTGVAAGDRALLACQSQIRESLGAPSAYAQLAAAIASLESLGVDPVSLDPYYGLADLSNARGWAAVSQVFAALDAGTNPICQRRWLEFAAPAALSPIAPIFPDAPPEARNQLREKYIEKSAAFRAALAPPGPVGGYRELLGYELFMENLAYAGDAAAIMDATSELPAEVAGIPAELWTGGYVVAWNTLGDAGTLALGNLIETLPQIESAAVKLPPSYAKGMMLAAAGLVMNSRSNPAGVERFAEAFLNPVPHPLLGEQYLKGLLNRTTGLNPQAAMTILNREPSRSGLDAQAKAARAALAIRDIDLFPPENRNATLAQALRDGAQALDLMETRRDPAQVFWRKQLKGGLVKAVSELRGDQAGAQADAGFGGPVQSNSSLGEFLAGPSVGAPPPCITGTLSAFDRLASAARSDHPSAIVSAVAATEPTELLAAARAIPPTFTTARQAKVAKAICDATAKLGLRQFFSAADRDAFDLRRAELMLLQKTTFPQAKRELAALTLKDGVASATGGRAATMLDALGQMESFEAYMWAQDWLAFMEQEFTEEKPYLANALSRPLVLAAARPEIQAWLSDPSAPALARQHHRYNIAMAHRMLGDRPAAIASLNAIIDASDAELAGDDVIRPIAEIWRLKLLHEEALANGDLDGQREILGEIVDYAQRRLPTLLGPEDARTRLARWGWFAARQLDDAEAQAAFLPLAAQASGARLF